MYGTPDQIADKLDELRAAGVGYVLVNGGGSGGGEGRSGGESANECAGGAAGAAADGAAVENPGDSTGGGP